MKTSERTGLIALVVFFISLAVAYYLPTWVFGIIGLVLVAFAFVFFARAIVQQKEEVRE